MRIATPGFIFGISFAIVYFDHQAQRYRDIGTKKMRNWRMERGAHWLAQIDL